MIHLDGINFMCFIAVVSLGVYVWKREQLDRLKKVTAILALVTFFLSFTGMRLMQANYAFGDLIYYSLLMYKGEWNVSLANGEKVNYWLQAGRFFAIFTSVTFIALVALRRRFMLRSVRVYKGHTIIVSNKPSGYIMDLAEAIKNKNTKATSKGIVVAYIDEIDVTQKQQNVDIPLIFLNLENNNAFEVGLRECNFESARSVYLLCEETEDNIQIAKKYFQKQEEINARKRECGDIRKISKEILNDDNDETDPVGSVEFFLQSIFNKLKGEIRVGQLKDADQNQPSREMIRMYIQCLTDEERSFYSFDRAFHSMGDNLDTVFINPYDISVRQMIIESHFMNRIGEKSQLNFLESKKNVEGINICVTGQGKLLERTIIEISRNLIFSYDKVFEITYIDCGDKKVTQAIEGLLSDNNLSREAVKIKSISLAQLKEMKGDIDMFFVSDVDERRIKTVMQRLFQHGIQNRTHEFFVLSKGNDSEYEVLNTYIGALFRNNNFNVNLTFDSRCHVSRVTDLLLSYDDFYKKFSPSREEVYKQYRDSIARSYKSRLKKGEKVVEETFIDLLEDFRTLPEIFKDSDTLCAIHNYFIIDYFKHVNLQEEGIQEAFEKILLELVYSEHHRWFNERVLQGYIYDENKNNLISTNSNLLTWSDCSEDQKSNHSNFTLKTINSLLDSKGHKGDGGIFNGQSRNDYIKVYEC